jgi:hypothetical protein
VDCPSNRFNFRTSAIVSAFEPNEEAVEAAEAEFSKSVVVGRDYTADLPNECFASIFHFLGSGDRRQCSFIYQQWLRVDGQNRHRLSLKAQADDTRGKGFNVPSLFTRFE